MSLAILHNHLDPLATDTPEVSTEEVVAYLFEMRHEMLESLIRRNVDGELSSAELGAELSSLADSARDAVADAKEYDAKWGSHEATLELRDGQILVEYDQQTGEILGIEDWHGNHNVSHRVERMAEEAVADAMGSGTDSSRCAQVNFAKLFKEVRTDLGMTQVQMAKALKLSQATVSKIETGGNKSSPMAETFIRLWRIIPEERFDTGCRVMQFMERGPSEVPSFTTRAGSDAWKAERRKWATASDLPSIMGVPGAYRSRAAVLREKVTGKEEVISGFKAALFAEGHEAEAMLGDRARDTFACDFSPAVILNEKLGILASLDAVNFERGIICEFKYSGAADVREARAKGQLPERYRIQVLAQMLATGFRKAAVFILDKTDGEVYAHKVEWCEETGERIAAAAKAFNADVAAQRTGDIEINDPRMAKLYQLLNKRQDIKEELAEPLKLLDAVEAEIDAVKKAIAEEFTHNRIVGNGVEIKKSKPAEAFDRSAAEAAGVDLRPFLKMNKPKVTASLVKEPA